MILLRVKAEEKKQEKGFWARASEENAPVVCSFEEIRQQTVTVSQSADGRGFGPAVFQPSISAPKQIYRRGQATMFQESYCDDVIEHMLLGYSLTSFAGRIGVTASCVHEWQRSFPIFGESVSRAKAARLLFWEKEAISVAQTGGQGSQATMIIFGLKNMGADEWKEKHEVAHSGQLSLGALVESSLKTLPALSDGAESTSSSTIEGDVINRV